MPAEIEAVTTRSSEAAMASDEQSAILQSPLPRHKATPRAPLLGEMGAHQHGRRNGGGAAERP